MLFNGQTLKVKKCLWMFGREKKKSSGNHSCLFVCVCKCVCVCVCALVWVVYGHTNLYNDMGMTEGLHCEGGL